MRKPQTTLITQFKVAACEMRTKALYYAQEADRLEEAIRLLKGGK